MAEPPALEMLTACQMIVSLDAQQHTSGFARIPTVPKIATRQLTCSLQEVCVHVIGLCTCWFDPDTPGLLLNARRHQQHWTMVAHDNGWSLNSSWPTSQRHGCCQRLLHEQDVQSDKAS